jgi:hypothetical protein
LGHADRRSTRREIGCVRMLCGLWD